MAAVNCNLQRSTVSVRRPADGRLEEITRNGHSLFQFKQTVCHACNGFYGPSFGHPLCCTCHAFLYPDVLSELDGDQGWKSDSEDSGNDEPEDFYDMVKHNVERPKLPAGGPKTDRLAECISALSSPRPQESTPDGVLAQLPLEVLSLIFRRLDDVSLWHCSQVCRRWRHILECELSEDHWSLFIKHRWPLFKPPHKVTSWRTLYSRLVASAPCRRCLQELREGPKGRAFDWGPEGSWRAVRLQQELRLLQTEPPEGIGAQPLDPLCAHWQAAIAGPPDSPYEGGQFLLFLQIPSAYPMKPPIVKFLTKIFHPNISRHGDIGIDSIQHNWSLALTISKVLISIQSLLTDPYCLVCMEPEVGRLYLEDRLGFERTARLWTLRYAMHGDPSDFHGHALESG
uniref:E2 ubiquitin-conjugating enzyme n=1 Tax=Rhipicephalus appendiculatus TaxID=34631 RepID=A0A131Z0I6_RHIAP